MKTDKLQERAWVEILAAKSQVKIPESAWLIESGVSGATYWLGREVGMVTRWTTDANKAIRFARKEDAEAMIWMLDDSPPSKATEHIWIDAAPSQSVGEQREE